MIFPKKMYRFIVMSSVELLQKWERQLQSLDKTNCVFSHHDADTDTFAPLCPATIQNTRHGCAHATNYILGIVIHEMTDSGELLPSEGSGMLSVINAEKHGTLAADDHSIALEPVDAIRYAAIKHNQKVVIDHRRQMTNIVLGIIQNRMDDLHTDTEQSTFTPRSMAHDRRLIGLPVV